MLVSLAYRSICILIQLIVRYRRADSDREVELIVLRHQVRVLQRKNPRPRYNRADRAIFAALSRSLERARWHSFMVTPKTVVRWHRDLVRRRHRRRSKQGAGRPRCRETTVELILRLADENRAWGYMRISGEMKKLGVRVAPSTVRRILIANGRRPAPRRSGPSWAEFLAAEAKAIIATDFFTVEPVTLKTLYVLFFIEHRARRVVIAGVTEHPTRAWVTQRARELAQGLPSSLGFLIRDRDSKFAISFDEVFTADDIRILKTPTQAPNANAIAERWVRTVRQELLDWVIVIGRTHLEALLDEYVDHYNSQRPHRFLGLVPPDPEEPIHSDKGPIAPSRVCRRDRLGGLVHEYELVG